MRVVFIRFSSMGDIILQTPIVSWLKMNFPNTDIHFITSNEFAPLINNHPDINSVHLYTRARGKKDIARIRKLAAEVKKIKADFVIDLHGSLRSKLLCFFLGGIPVIRVFKRSFLRSLLVKFKFDFLKTLEAHHERVIKDTCVLFGKTYDRARLEDFNRSRSEFKHMSLSSTAQTFSEKNNKQKMISISPVASFETKRWPIEYYIELTKMMLNDSRFADFEFVILGGPNDTYCDAFNSLEDSRVKNLQGKTSLNESNHYMAQSILTITNDTGSAHMSESFGVPVLNFFGATSPSFGFRTHLDKSISLYANYSCSPCSNTGSKKCSKKSIECLEAISPKQAFESVITIIEEA